MTTRWEQYYKKEMRKPKVKKLMEKSLELGEYHISLIKKGLRVAGEGKLVSHAEVKKLIAKMGRNKRGSPANVRKALKILARAGKKNPPVPGDGLFGADGSFLNDRDAGVDGNPVENDVAADPSGAAIGLFE